MTSNSLHLNWRISVGAATLFLAGAVWAQAPDQQPVSHDRPMLRQPTPSSVQQQEDGQGAAEKRETEADKKLREMDRRLARTLRSVCSGCER
ncbi:hypothetical protein [Microvirga calopogonii]|uniref:hypothetical protein n=1 Tax=Microvirga calopogonii TaxID=2078013 RepID=UPI000E0DD384|nr:hypothetical protein [Microvirga calopogonii]